MPDLAQLVQEFSGGSCFWVREIIQCIKDNGSEQFMQAVGENDNSNTRKCYFWWAKNGHLHELHSHTKPFCQLLFDPLERYLHSASDHRSNHSLLLVIFE